MRSPLRAKLLMALIALGVYWTYISFVPVFFFEMRLYLLFTLFSETCKVKTTRPQGQDSVILYSSWLYKKMLHPPTL
jgi:hypothetical protein